MSIENGLSKLPHSVGVLCILCTGFAGVFLLRLPAPLKIVQSLVIIKEKFQ